MGPPGKSGTCQRCRFWVLCLLGRGEYRLCRECAHEWDWRVSTIKLDSRDEELLAGYVAEGGGL